MSWELSGVQKHKCPCGRRTYTVRLLTDDWNRSDEQWNMNCSDCNRRYTLYRYSYPDSGMILQSYCWVKKKLFARMRMIQAELEKCRRNAVRLFQSRYKEKWLSRFSECKSKKTVWKLLTQNGRRYPSLPTFYSHTKNKDLEGYLIQQLTFDNLSFVLKMLSVKDNKLRERIKKATQMSRRYRTAKAQLMREGFK